MTKEEIAKALKLFVINEVEDDIEWGIYLTLTFALKMVRRHNDECTKIAEEHKGHPISFNLNVGCPTKIAAAIRKAKP